MTSPQNELDDDEIDLEDDQFKRARLDTSCFPHYELKSTDNNNENDGAPKKKSTDDLFGAGYDDDDDTGDFPFSDKKEKDDEIDSDLKEKKDDGIEIVDITPNPLYVYNYWQRYQSLTLFWPNCDGKCGNKFGKLIHNELYLKEKNKNNNNNKNMLIENESNDMILFIDNYQLTAEDMNAIKVFSTLNPLQMQSDEIIQMWSFIDNLKSRVEEYNQNATEIAHERKVHEIINQDIESTLNVKEIISKHFLCYSTPIRRYMISLLDSFNEYRDNDNTSYSFYSLLKLLRDKENIICDDKQTLDIWKRLINLKESNHYFILYQLSRYSCYHHNNTIFQELKRNGFHTITPNLYTNDMVRIIKTKQYGMMRKYNLELTAEEIISILIYTGSDEISRSVRESLIMENRSCKWMHLTNNLVSAVEKMHKILVQTKYKKDLPEKLYYAIGAAIGRKRLRYFDVISTTSNVDLALKFMTKGTMIIFDKTNDMLQTSRFIAAPLNWITSRKNINDYSEWLVTCIKIYDSGTIKKKSNDGNYTITCNQYETIPFRSMATWRKVVDAAMILDQTNQSLLYAANAAISNCNTFKCLHCKSISPIYWYQGNILMDNMECCYCRRYNLFSFNVPQRIVPCFNCKQQSMLKQYVIKDKKGAFCPKCNEKQCISFIKSQQFEKMVKYLSIDNGYKEKQRRKQQQQQQQKKRDEEEKQKRRQEDIASFSSLNATGTDIESNKKKTKKGGFFRWKKPKSVKSSNLNDIEENSMINDIEDEFD